MNNFYHSFLRISKLVMLASFLSISVLFGQDGSALFKQNCASCHHPVKNGTGPALKGAKAKWEAAGDNIYEWVRNPQAQYEAGVKSALAIQYNVGGMNGQAVSDEEIDAIFEYVEAYNPPPPPDGGDTAGGPGAGSDRESSSWFWFLVIGLILISIIVSLWGVRRQLKYANQEKEGEKVEEQDLKEELGSWAWRNLKLVSVLGFIATCALVYWLAERGYQVGVFEDYVPDQPIAFNHSIHAGDNEIDCQYCHNSASKSKHAGIPTVNVCMNCHKAIKEGRSAAGTAEIAKIHEAAGFNPETNKYTGETEPIKWIKAHNLPDHVYFSHAQHVEVGKIECENCHGPVKTYTVGRTANSEMINEMAITGEGLRDPQTQKSKIIQLENQVLTMGWCIECHNKAEVKMEGSEYYDDIHERLKRDKELYKSVMEDGKVNVKEFGGWECAKCHY